MKSLAHIALLVGNLDAMESFYRTVFDMYPIWRRDNDKAYLTTGNNDILGLQQVDDGLETSEVDLDLIATEGPTPKFIHFGINTDSELEFNEIISRVQVSGTSVTDLKTSRDGSVACYFLDPEKNVVQITYTPPGYYQDKVEDHTA